MASHFGMAGQVNRLCPMRLITAQFRSLRVHTGESITMESEDVGTAKPLWVEILQWIAVLPGAFLGAWAVYIIFGLMHGLFAPRDDPSWWLVITREFFTNGAMGAAFVFFAVCIAPSFKVQVSFIFAGIVFGVTVIILIIALQDAYYISILSSVFRNAGAILIAVKTHRAQGIPDI